MAVPSWQKAHMGSICFCPSSLPEDKQMWTLIIALVATGTQSSAAELGLTGRETGGEPAVDSSGHL